VFVVSKIWAAVAASGIVLGAAYMLWLYQRTMFGKIENPKNETLQDMSLREIMTFVPLIILAVWIGIYPTPFLNRLTTSVDRVVARVSPQYLQQNANAADCDKKPAPSKWQVAPCGPEEEAKTAAAPEGTVPAGAPTPAATPAAPAADAAAPPVDAARPPAQAGKTAGGR
jgi:NADH-quinone oxidoreductase subunit M